MARVTSHHLKRMSASMSCNLRAVACPGKIHEHARIYRLRSVAGSQILNFMS